MHLRDEEEAEEEKEEEGDIAFEGMEGERGGEEDTEWEREGRERERGKSAVQLKGGDWHRSRCDGGS